MTDTTARPADSRDMYVVHNTLRQGFHGLPDLARGLSDGEERAELVAAHADLLVEVLHTHHEAEDAVLWPKLLERCPDAIAPAVETMEEQHQRLEGALRKVAQSAALLRESRSANDAGALADAVEELNPLMDEHLGDEERQILPLIDAWLTQAEWAAVGEHGLPEIPEQIIPVYFGMVLRAATEDQRAVLQSNVGPEVFGQITAAGPPALEAYEDALYARTE